MVKQKTNNKRGVKHSSSPLTKLVNEQVQKVMHNRGGTVTYFFDSERIIFTSDKPNGEVITRSSVLQSNINQECFNMSPTEFYKIFSTTAHDLGATKFELG